MTFVPFASTTFWRQKLAVQFPGGGGAQPDSDSANLISHLISDSNVVSTGYGLGNGVPLYDGSAKSRRTDLYVRNPTDGNHVELMKRLDGTLSWGGKSGVPWDTSWVSGGGNDHCLVVYDSGTDECWEFNGMQVDVNGIPNFGFGGWKAEISRDPWGNYRKTLDSGSNQVEWPFWGSRGSGLPLSVGLITVDDINAGVINHALAVALKETRSGSWAWTTAHETAQRTDGVDAAAHALPEGACLYIPSSVDISGLSGLDAMVAKCLQDYGAYICDQTNGGTTFYSQTGVQSLVAGLSHSASNLPWSQMSVAQMSLQTSQDNTAVTLP